MMRTTLLAASAIALAACGQQAQAPQTAEGPLGEMRDAAQLASVTDADFVRAALRSEAFQIEMARLAAERAHREDVRMLAAESVRESEANTQRLAQLAPTLNVDGTPPPLAAGQQSRIQSLAGQTGESFDDAFLDAQVSAQQEAVRTYETYIANAEDGPLRDWAQETLPELQSQLQQVQSLEDAT